MGHGLLIEQGTFDGRLLQLQINLGRVDWLLLPRNISESDKIDSLGTLGESAEYFRGLVSKWLIKSSPLNRLAFGASLFIPTGGQLEAVQEIRGILPSLGIDWQGVRDFVYQVNRPRACTTSSESGPINRIAKWQDVLRQTIVATLLPQGQAPVSVGQQPVANLEIDINTSIPSDAKKELPQEKLSSILEELTENAIEIALSGDVK